MLGLLTEKVIIRAIVTYLITVKFADINSNACFSGKGHAGLNQLMEFGSESLDVMSKIILLHTLNPSSVVDFNLWRKDRENKYYLGFHETRWTTTKVPMKVLSKQ